MLNNDFGKKFQKVEILDSAKKHAKKHAKITRSTNIQILFF